jgi:hypothetical protein
MLPKTTLWAPFGALLCGILLAQSAPAGELRNPAAPLVLVDDDDDDDNRYRRRWNTPRIDQHWRGYQERRGYVLRDWDDDDDDRYRRRWRRRRDDDDDDD